MALRLLIAACLTVAASAAADETAEPLRPALESLARQDTTAAVRWLVQAHRSLQGPSGSILLGRVYREQGSIVSRLRSQEVLEDARRRYPRDLDVRMELGRTYFAQGFFPDAIACFNDVLRADPHRCDARYLYALYHFNNWKRVNDFQDDLRTARRELRAAVDCDTANADAAIKYLVARYALADTSAAEAARMVRRFPNRGEFRLYRGVLAYDGGRYEDCRADFLTGIDRLDETSRLAYGGVERILTGSEQRDLAFADTDSVARSYWVLRDPDPTTALNERELEHVYRMFLADVVFSPARSARPGWETPVHGWETDRGEAFLKFGRPASVYYTLGDDPSSGRVEVWSYVLGGVFHQFLFVDEYLNGNPRIPYSADVVLHFLRESPRQTDYHPLVAPLPGALDVVAFRDDALSASLYFALRVDADSLGRVLDLARVNHFRLRTAWFDNVWRRAGGNEEEMWTSELPERRDGERRFYEVSRRERVSFERLNVACAFEDENGDARALLVAEADAARFMSDRLVLSDILLTAAQGPSAAMIVRHGGQLWPHIDHTYGTGEMLGIYVEIYNLARVASASNYDITFTIYPGTEQDEPAWMRWGRSLARHAGFGVDPAIAQTFHRTGLSHNEHESIRIDVSRLAAGPYDLVIEVTDGNSGDIASTQTSFRREEPRVAERE